MLWEISWEGKTQASGMKLIIAAHFIHTHRVPHRIITARNEAGDEVTFIGKPKGARLLWVGRSLQTLDVTDIPEGENKPSEEEGI
jgi:hypothetical protein